jgi:hypothetical protein
MKKLISFFTFVAILGFVFVSCSGSGSGSGSDNNDLRLTGTVSISGTAQVGQTLTANTSALGGSGTIFYQWNRVSVYPIPIYGANSRAYEVQAVDAGYTITVTVTRDGYYDSVTSNPTATVTNSEPALTGTVGISGTAQVGQTLTAITGSLGGSGTISYQWKQNSTSGGTTTNIGTNSNTYVLQTADVGYTITVTVTRSGYSSSVSSSAIGPILGYPGTATLTITFAQIADAAPSITGPTLYRVSNSGPTSATLTVDNPSQYDSNSISWRVQNTTVTGTGASFILSAANTAYNLIGEHFVTVLVMKDGVPYNKTVSFKIEY